MNRWPLTIRGTGAVLLAVAAFVLAQLFGIASLLWFTVLLLCAVGAAIASLHLSHRAERVARTCAPETGVVGQDVTVRIRVDSVSILPTVGGRWEDRLPPGTTGPAAGAFPGLPSGLTPTARAVDLDYRATTQRRGVHAIGPLTITTTDPFGFARRTRAVGDAVAYTVAPAVIEVPALAELPGAAGGSQHSQSDRLGQGADNLIPRAYVPGDSMRRIHWRASAHRGDLMVRQEEQESNPDATVVFDRAIARWGDDALLRPGEDPGFELAVSACVSAVARLVREGYTVEVVDIDGTELADPIEAGDLVAVEALTVAFATVTARREGDPADLVRLCAGATLGPLVLVTGALTRADVATLAPVVPHTALPVLLVVSADADVLDDAARSGWRTLGMEPDDDPVTLWGFAPQPVPEGGARVR